MRIKVLFYSAPDLYHMVYTAWYNGHNYSIGITRVQKIVMVATSHSLYQSVQTRCAFKNKIFIFYVHYRMKLKRTSFWLTLYGHWISGVSLFKYTFVVKIPKQGFLKYDHIIAFGKWMMYFQTWWIRYKMSQMNINGSIYRSLFRIPW